MEFFENKNKIGLNFLILGILVWWSGIAGRDLYMVPVLIGLIFMTFQVCLVKYYQKIFGKLKINELNTMSQKNKKVVDGKGISRINKIVFSHLIK